MDNKKIEGVLFDLDGTLADTAMDLGYTLNVMLKRRNLPEVSLDKFKYVVSDGVLGLLKLGFAVDVKDSIYNDLKEEFLVEYEKNLARESVLFKNIDDLIIELNGLGIRWGIVTNKIMRFTNPLVKKLKFPIFPMVVVSGDTTEEPKPSIKPMLFASEKIETDPENIICIGDDPRDIVAGNNAGMKTGIANWGYIHGSSDINTWGASYILNNPLELLDYI